MIHPGAQVMIWGGVSDLAHGEVQSVETGYERPFALVRLRRKDGKLSKDKTLVPLSRCIQLPQALIDKTLEEKRAWCEKWHRQVE